jgi:hypothetical protein
MSPRVVRTKTTELTAAAEGRFQLLARLTDVSHDCDWGPDGQGGVIHDFEVEGEIEGEDLIVTKRPRRAGSAVPDVARDRVVTSVNAPVDDHCGRLIQSAHM